jgi:hypothetical protein
MMFPPFLLDLWHLVIPLWAQSSWQVDEISDNQFGNSCASAAQTSAGILHLPLSEEIAAPK